MTTTVHHLRGADDLAAGGSFEPTSSSSTLCIEQCDTITLSNANAVHQQLAALGIDGYKAAVGKPFTINGTNASASTEFGPLLVRSLTVVEHPDKPNAWIVQIEETSMGSPIILGDTPTGSPDLTVNQTSRTRNLPTWRADYGNIVLGTDTIVQPGGSDFYFDPAEWAMCDSTADDVVGVPVDVGGKPISYAVNQRHISIEYIARSPWKDWSGSWRGEAFYNEAVSLSTQINKRNAEPLFGFGVGELLLADVSIQPLHHEFKRVVLSFVWDYWKHADQRPWQTKSGIVATTDQCGDQTSDLVNMQAETVWWTQPYLGAFTMGANPANDFPAGVWGGIWDKLNADSSGYTQAEGP